MLMLSWHPYIDSSWEKQVNDWSKNSIWVGLYEILLIKMKIYQIFMNLNIIYH